MKLLSKKNIPIFYAADENYLPYLAVSLSSLKDNINKEYIYNIYILHTDIKISNQEPILSFNDINFNVSFINISEKMNKINEKIQLRDYYTCSTYYRVFIADIFKEYDKAIYLDSDTIILDDISKLYEYELNENLVGAINDQVVNNNEVFSEYSLKVLGINANKYFNAGVLLLNLKKFREYGFYKIFCTLLKIYKFEVAQDQDYLNIICKNKVLFLPIKWNVMPTYNKKISKPSIIHYNLTAKPWHYEDIVYAKYFWKYAKENYYYSFIKKTLEEYTEQKKKEDLVIENKLLELAKKEINKENNFINLMKIIFNEEFDLLNSNYLEKIENYINEKF